MGFHIYKFSYNDNTNIFYKLLKNKSLNDVKKNIRGGRLKIEELNGIEKWNIEYVEEVDKDNKKDAEIYFADKYLNKVKEGCENCLIGIIKHIQSKDDLSALSVKTYINNTKLLFKIYYDKEDYNNEIEPIINNIDKLKDKIDEKINNITTKRQLWVMLVWISKIDYLKIDDDKKEAILKMMYDVNDKHIEKIKEDSQFEMNISSKKLIHKATKLYENKEISSMIYLILLLAIINPKRDDYHNIKVIYNNIVINDEAMKTLKEKYPNYDGFYIKSSYTFIITDYKNAKKYGDDKFIITNEKLKDVIDKTFKDYPERDLLIENQKGTNYTTLTNIIKQHLNINLNDLRKIYTKEKGSYEAKKDLKHSYNTNRSYYSRK